MASRVSLYCNHLVGPNTDFWFFVARERCRQTCETPVQFYVFRAADLTMPSPLAGATDTIMRALIHAQSYSQDDTLLNTSLIRGGVEHAGNDERLGCVLARLKAGERVTVAAVGGSVSAGSSYTVRRGLSSSFLYHMKVVRALRAGFPVRGAAGNHRHHNGALPATGPKFYEHCVLGQLPKDGADLVLLEFAVNTDRRAPACACNTAATAYHPLVCSRASWRVRRAPAAFERTLRKLLALQPRPAVVVVNVHAWTMRRDLARMAPCWHPPKAAKRRRCTQRKAGPAGPRLRGRLVAPWAAPMCPRAPTRQLASVPRPLSGARQARWAAFAQRGQARPADAGVDGHLQRARRGPRRRDSHALRPAAGLNAGRSARRRQGGPRGSARAFRNGAAAPPRPTPGPRGRAPSACGTRSQGTRL